MFKLQKCSYLSREALNQLVNDPSSSVELIQSPCNIALQPHHCKDINESITKILRKDIGKHFHLCKGILLGFQNLMACSQYNGVLIGDSPTTYHAMQAEFFVFKAAVGKVLKGIVNEKGRGHVKCLVHQTFNVSILKPNGNDEWVGNYVWQGAEISVEITAINFLGRMPYFKGALREILSEPPGGFSEANKGTEQQTTKTIIKCMKHDENSVPIPNKP